MSAADVNSASANGMAADSPGSMIKLVTCADDLSAPAVLCTLAWLRLALPHQAIAGS